MLAIVAGIEYAISEAGRHEHATLVSFPPLIPRELLRRVGYADNFPQLIGSIHTFAGNERQHLAFAESVKQGGDWSAHLAQTELVLAPAACYPLYPTLAGTLPAEGALFDLTGTCFRNEPSDDPARMQYFQVHERIFAGTPSRALEWRGSWRERGLELLRSLGLDASTDIASDPFFGRAGKLMRQNQEEQQLKWEVLVPIWPGAEPTAVASFNYHHEHFSHAFGINCTDGQEAHTACLGFGIDRVAIALLKTHGTNLSSWPVEVQRRMSL